ncbi:MAG: exodeoxyribonuclease VII large subunit, partial [Bradyrhizobiaceae bacterium]|nr:exodeoxyribonuclease VII large subunit [Bradyrhizobiaceae bacterium]
LRARVVQERDRVHRAGRAARQCLRVHVERRRERFSGVAARLSSALRSNARARRVLIAQYRDRTRTLLDRAERAARTLISLRRARLERAGQLLAALSYHGVLARGFALVRDKGGKTVRTAAAVSPGMRLDIEFTDGHVPAVANGGDKSRPPGAAKTKTPRSGGEGQGNLFEP